MSTRRGESPERAIAREADAPRRAGYSEIPLELHAQMIVQYRVGGHGRAGDLEKLTIVEGVLNECLGWTGNGHCDGHDIGSGSMNAFCLVLDPVKACEAAVSALRAAGVFEGAVVANVAGDGFQVLWLCDFKGEFAYAYGA